MVEAVALEARRRPHNIKPLPYIHRATMRLLHLTFLVLITPALGFVPSVSTRQSVSKVSSPPFLLSSLSSETSITASVNNPFASYQLGQSTLAYKDEVVGQGESGHDGDVLKVSYVGRLYPSGQQIAKNEDFVFELGEGKTLPGFDKALWGTQVGTRRIIRVPPSLAYGNRGYAVSATPGVLWY